MNWRASQVQVLQFWLLILMTKWSIDSYNHDNQRCSRDLPPVTGDWKWGVIVLPKSSSACVPDKQNYLMQYIQWWIPIRRMANNSDNSDNNTKVTSIQNQVREHNCLLENSWIYQLFLIWFSNIIIMIRTCLIPAMNCPIEGPITHRLRLSLALNIGCVCVVWKFGSKKRSGY